MVIFQLNTHTHSQTHVLQVSGKLVSKTLRVVAISCIFISADLCFLTFPQRIRSSPCTLKVGVADTGCDGHTHHTRCPSRRPGQCSGLSHPAVTSTQPQLSCLLQNPFCIKKGGILKFISYFLAHKSCRSSSFKHCLNAPLKKQGNYSPIPCCRKETL